MIRSDSAVLFSKWAESSIRYAVWVRGRGGGGGGGGREGGEGDGEGEGEGEGERGRGYDMTCAGNSKEMLQCTQQPLVTWFTQIAAFNCTHSHLFNIKHIITYYV